MIKFGIWLILTGIWLWLFNILSTVHQYAWYGSLGKWLKPLYYNFLNNPAAWFVAFGSALVVIGLLNVRYVTRDI
jgi:vacuolar-type H+-ATPase subunit I/STV1